MSKITDIGAALDPQFERVSDTPRTDEQYNREKQYRSITNVTMSSHGFDAIKILCGELERELAEAKAQLPAEMQECNIVFKQCKLGHGWLTATNWVQHECQICELAEAQAEIVRLKGEAESWEQVFDRACELLADTKCKLTEAVAMKEGK